MAWPLPIPETCSQKSSITRRLTQKERGAVANNLRQIGYARVLAAILADAPAPILEISPRGSEKLMPAALSSVQLGQSSDTPATRAPL
jgi:hypothetical protein